MNVWLARGCHIHMHVWYKLIIFKESCWTSENTCILINRLQQRFYSTIVGKVMVNETCAQCVRHSDPRHTVDGVFIHRCCNQRSAVAVLATPARSPAPTDQRVSLPVPVCRCRVAPAGPPKWRNPSDLNPGCSGSTCPAQRRRHSVGTR